MMCRLAMLWMLVSAACAVEESAPWPVRDVIRTWRVGSGLPHQRVLAVTQTDDGYLWVGTAQGLARFDGKEFTRADLPESAGGRDAAVTKLTAGAGNRLWVGTGKGYLLCGSGMEFGFPDGCRDKVFSGFEVLAEDRDGRLWITLGNGSVLRWAGGKLQDMNALWQASAGWPGGQVRLTKERLPMANSTGMVARVEGDALRPLEGFAGGMIYHAPCTRDSCWVSDHEGVRKLGPGGLSAVIGPADWGERSLTFGLDDHEGNLWLATQGFGLVCYGGGGKARRVDTRDGLCGDFAVCMYEDRQGNLWVGSDGGGLSRITPAVFAAAGRREGLSSDRVTSVLRGDDGFVWIGTHADGLNRYDGTAFSREPLVPKDARVKALAHADGLLWVGLNNGLWCLENDKLWNIGGWQEAGRQVNALLRDRSGALWVGQRLAGKTMRLVSGHPEEVKLAGMHEETDVIGYSEDGEGNMWIATDGAGLFRWNHGDTQRVGDFKQVEALTARKRGGIWLSADGALHSADATGVARLGAAPGHVTALAEVDGKLWTSGSTGIRLLEITPGGIVERRFSQAHGMPDLQGADSGFPQIHDGPDGLWIATSTGILRANTAALTADPPLDSLRIDALIANGAACWRRGDPAVPELRPDARNFELRFSSIDLCHPDSVRYACRMDGLDDGWRDLGASRFAVYPALSPGKHVFRVKAMNQSGLWSGERELAFAIRLPLAQKLWFLVAMACAGATLVGGVVWGVGAWRIRRKLAALRVEQAVGAERVRISSDLHDHLGAELTGIALLGDHLQMEVSQDDYLAENLSDLSRRARGLAREMEETVWALDPRQDHLESLISYLSQSMHHWLRNSGIRCHLDVPDQADRFGLNAQQRRQIFLACKEAVNNAVKHSGASEIRLMVQRQLNQLQITIRDNGTGFAPDQVARGCGLDNIRRRISLLGGSAVLSSGPGGPSEWSFLIPLPIQTNL